MTAEQNWEDWIGRSSTVEDVASAAPLRVLNALLDRPDEELAVVPPLGHWLHCLPVATQSDIGPDGHIAMGQDLPPLGLPRRMWAGSRVDFRAPLKTGSRIARRTAIKSISKKQGSSGPLAFVTLLHEISADGVLAISEEQDLVYREAHAPGSQSTRADSGAVVEASGHVHRVLRLDPVQLFRFSAVTLNAHRIHYDADYARGVEGYPGLVVHGPLQAIILMNLFRDHHPDARIKAFQFRGKAPLFAGEDAVFGLVVDDGAANLWVQPENREVSFVASIQFDRPAFTRWTVGR